MANVNIKFNNKDYLLSCDDGQEEDLKNQTNERNERTKQKSKTQNKEEFV